MAVWSCLFLANTSKSDKKFDHGIICLQAAMVFFSNIRADRTVGNFLKGD